MGLTPLQREILAFCVMAALSAILAVFLFVGLSGCAHAPVIPLQPAVPSAEPIARASNHLRASIISDTEAVSILAPAATNSAESNAVTVLETNLSEESATVTELQSNVATLQTAITNLATDDSATHANLSNSSVTVDKLRTEETRDRRVNTFVVFFLSCISTSVFLRAFWKPMTGAGGWASILVALGITSGIFTLGCAFWFFALIWASSFFPALF
jgi:hypothetical protein